MRHALCAILAVAFLAIATSGLEAEGKSGIEKKPASVAGKWSGTWTNSLGESGESNLDLNEDEDGALQGTWDGVAVKGTRTNNSLELRGQNQTRSYEISCTLDGSTMQMKYTATRLNMDLGMYQGKAMLKRTGITR